MAAAVVPVEPRSARTAEEVGSRLPTAATAGVGFWTTATDGKAIEIVAGVPPAIATNTGSSRAIAAALAGPHSAAEPGVRSPRLASTSLPFNSASMSSGVRRIFPC